MVSLFMELRETVEKKIADQMIIASHFLITRFASFKQTVEALILADRNLNQGRNEEILRDIFIRRGICQI